MCIGQVAVRASTSVPADRASRRRTCAMETTTAVTTPTNRTVEVAAATPVLTVHSPLTVYYSAADRGAEYCDERVRLCACVTIRYDTRCYFNVRSKADMSRLNLPHGDDN